MTVGACWVAITAVPYAVSILDSVGDCAVLQQNTTWTCALALGVAWESALGGCLWGCGLSAVLDPPETIAVDHLGAQELGLYGAEASVEDVAPATWVESVGLASAREWLTLSHIDLPWLIVVVVGAGTASISVVIVVVVVVVSTGAWVVWVVWWVRGWVVWWVRGWVIWRVCCWIVWRVSHWIVWWIRGWIVWWVGSRVIWGIGGRVVWVVWLAWTLGWRWRVLYLLIVLV